MFRVDPPSGVDWHDVDFDEVVELRRRLLPEREQAHPIAASLVDPHWMERVPRDRPTIVVADGVAGFLTENDNKRSLTGLTEHFTGRGSASRSSRSRRASRHRRSTECHGRPE